MTNSLYAVVVHPIVFKDVERHWAEAEVNDMGSRMIISGNGNGLFNPDQDITRAEFTAIVVRALGLKLESGPTTFTDIRSSDWYSSAIQAAFSYGLITGYEDGSFGPSDKITREQAMSIIAKAMSLTGLKDNLPAFEAGELLQSFADSSDVALWARGSVAASIQAGIVSGRSAAVLAPKENITRAEVAIIIQRLLLKSELI
ncbi:S-layer homology domain-containing protein, partial [Paenibacillus sp. MCAF20]